MKRQLGFLAWFAGLAGLAVPGVQAEAPAQSPKIRVVIVDGQNNHNWKATTPFMTKVLEESGRFTVAVSTAPGKDGKTETKGTAPFPPILDDFDVVLSNYNGSPWPADFQRALEDRLKGGKVGLVIVHAANNAFGSWSEYYRMIGMGWQNNKFGDRLIVDAQGKEVRVPKGQGPGAGHGPRHPFRVVVRDPSHPVTQGMPHEWMHAIDELYHGMRGPIEHVHLLATAYDDPKQKGTGEHEPMIWTVAYGNGRVFHTVMGHDLEAMRCVGFITTLQRGTEWVATGKVTVPLPANFPTANKTSTVSAK